MKSPVESREIDDKNCGNIDNGKGKKGGSECKEIKGNGCEENIIHIQNGFSDKLETNDAISKQSSINCEKCGTLYTDELIQKFVKAMEISESNLQSMKNNSVACILFTVLI